MVVVVSSAVLSSPTLLLLPPPANIDDGEEIASLGEECEDDAIAALDEDNNDGCFGLQSNGLDDDTCCISYANVLISIET